MIFVNFMTIHAPWVVGLNSQDFVHFPQIDISLSLFPQQFLVQGMSESSKRKQKLEMDPETILFYLLSIP
jgi:hypothetical protein